LILIGLCSYLIREVRIIVLLQINWKAVNPSFRLGIMQNHTWKHIIRLALEVEISRPY
jgi:Ser-tRNA(Ala) deacylase AlaX